MITFTELYELLRHRVPAGTWWPAHSRYEIIVGAILTQNTAWTNVEKALLRMREEKLLTPEKLMECSETDLSEVIRPAGYMRAKARYLHEVTRWYLDNDHQACTWQTEELRHQLLQVHGVGPETADDLLLYVYERPVFIWDTYARRLLQAAGYDVPSTYESARRQLQVHVSKTGFDVEKMKIFHGLIVDAGKIAKRHGGWDSYWKTFCAEDSAADAR